MDAEALQDAIVKLSGLLLEVLKRARMGRIPYRRTGGEPSRRVIGFRASQVMKASCRPAMDGQRRPSGRWPRDPRRSAPFSKRPRNSLARNMCCALGERFSFIRPMKRPAGDVSIDRRTSRCCAASARRTGRGLHHQGRGQRLHREEGIRRVLGRVAAMPQFHHAGADIPDASQLQQREAFTAALACLGGRQGPDCAPNSAGGNAPRRPADVDPSSTGGLLINAMPAVLVRALPRRRSVRSLVAHLTGAWRPVRIPGRLDRGSAVLGNIGIYEDRSFMLTGPAG